MKKKISSHQNLNVDPKSPEFREFDTKMKEIIKVSKEEILKREKEDREKPKDS